ncbi:MAG: hypothetical protein ACLP6E_00535 [Acidimicrobiales bacterium]
MADENDAPAEEPVGGWDISGEIQVGDGVETLETPLPAEGASTPLEDEEPEGTIPPAPLWAMKDRRHFFGLPGHGDAERVRVCVGQGDGAVYFIDDGRSHCMVGRRVGASPEGLTYCLIGRVTSEHYLKTLNGERRLAEAFSDAHDIELCGVYEDETMVSEVIAVEHFRHVDDVPPEYLPPSPFIEFEDDLPVKV